MATTVMSNAFGWIFRPKSVRGSDLSTTSQAITDRALIPSTDNTIVKKVGDDNSSSSSSSSSHSQSIASALIKSKVGKSDKLSRKSAAAEIQMTVSTVFKYTRWLWEAPRTALLFFYSITVNHFFTWENPSSACLPCTPNLLYNVCVRYTVDLPVTPSEARVFRGPRGRVRGGLYNIQGRRPFEFSFNCYSSCCQTTEGSGGNLLICRSTTISKSQHHSNVLLQDFPFNLVLSVLFLSVVDFRKRFTFLFTGSKSGKITAEFPHSKNRA